MELVFKKTVSPDVLEELKLNGLDPLLEPDIIAEKLKSHVEEVAGERLLGSLHQFILGADSFLAVRNAFDPGALGDSPETFFTSGTTDWYPGAYTTLAVLAASGLHPVSFHSENRGELIVNLTVIPGVGRKSDKSRKELRGHTDACSFPFAHEFDPEEGVSPSPDFVVLIGQKNHDKVPTCVAPLSKILKEMPEWAIEELKKEQFMIGTQGLFDIDYVRDDASILTIHPDFGYQIRFSHSHVTSDPALHKATNAIKKLEAATQKCLKDVVVNPGDILLVNNRTALHGRRTVCDAKTKSGGNTRWLQRLYANLESTKGLAVDEAKPFCLAPESGWVG